jgi:hypothetical protein
MLKGMYEACLVNMKTKASNSYSHDLLSVKHLTFFAFSTFHESRTCNSNKAHFHQVDSSVTLTYAMPMRAIKDKTNIMQTYMLRYIARN